jgi:hypothetical protein
LYDRAMKTQMQAVDIIVNLVDGKCQQVANAGGFECNESFAIIAKDVATKKMLRLCAAEAPEELVSFVEKRMKNRGFDERSYFALNKRPKEKIGSIDEVDINVHMFMSWKKCVEDKPKSNVRGRCHICIEDDSNLLVLVPCGHTQCTTCAPTTVGKACPVCKARVSSLQGVFIDHPDQGGGRE